MPRQYITKQKKQELLTQRDVRANIFCQLLANVESDPKFLPFTQKIVNTPSEMLGVKIPSLRKLAKQAIKDYSSDCWQAILGTDQAISFEETTLAGLIMAETKDISAAYKLLVDFCPRIDNWATCDVVCSSFKVFNKDKTNAYLDRFIALAKSKQEFTARVGLVMLMDYYLKPDAIDKVLACVETLTNHAYYVDMAAAWLLSVAIIKCPEPAVALIKSKTLTPFVQNKAISKCGDSFRISADLKTQLKRYKI